MNDSAGTYAESGDVAKDITQRVAIMRHFDELGLVPFFRRVDSVAPPRVNIEGTDCVMLGSNSYLGLSCHPDVVAAAVDATKEFGVGTTGSRLLNGTYAVHAELERVFADWFGTEAALVFTTGYQANLGALQALLDVDCLAVVDSLVHASLRDGVRLSRAVEAKFAHNDSDSLAAVLREHAETGFRRKMVIVDSVYSMEGDTAPLERIIEICKEHNALLFVDEAHGVGVFGPTGAGLVEQKGLREHVDVLMGSLTKSIGSLGGFIAASRDLVDEIRLSARAFWFSASGTPAAMAAGIAATRIIRSAEGAERRARLERNSRLMRTALEPLDVGFKRTDENSPDWSPVIPVRLRDEMRTMLSCNQIREAGVFITPVVYPAVPLGEPVLRVSMTSELSEQDVLHCAEVLADKLSWALQPA